MRLAKWTSVLFAVVLSGQTVPEGFTDTLVASISSPTAIAFLPDGRMLVTSQGGTLRVLTGNTATVAATFPANRICTNSERGLLGVAVDPEFAQNSFIYLYYTHRADGVTCGSRTLPMPMNRVSRFVLRANNTVDLTSETVLISNIPSWNGNHNGGDLQFGTDGHLYISIGDSGCDPYGSGCAGTNDAARDVHTLLGKVLRIRKDGSIPADNPWLGEGTARCNEQNAAAGVRCQETWSWGLRNPFRIAVSTTGRLFMLDVGQNVWEEINEAAPGADYGWNQREGACVNGSRTNCPPPPSNLTDPIFAYPHGTCDSISGGAFIPPGYGPVEFEGGFLFADYICGTIFRLSRSATTGTYQSTTFATLPSGTIHLAFGPGGLYYSTYANGGKVRRIASTVVRPNAPPTAILDPVTNATAGAPITFRALTNDRDGDAITAFIWNFGDGTSEVTTNTGNTTHTYRQPGRYTVTLRVRDARGADSAPASIDVVVTPSDTRIIFPDASSRFWANDDVELRATASCRWTATLIQGSERSLYATFDGPIFPLRTPSPATLDATSSTALEITCDGNTVLFRPQLVPVTLESDPPGLVLNVNGKTVTTPATFESWPRYPLYITAPDQQGLTATTRSQKLITPVTATTVNVAYTGNRELSRLQILDAAGYVAQNLAPRSMGAIRATDGLAFTSGATIQASGDLPWPETLGGLQVSFADRFLPLYVADPGMITFKVPASIEPNKRDLLRVWRDGQIVDQTWMTIDTTAPGIFADGQTAALFEGKQPIVKVLATGLRNATEPIEVLVNGTPAEGVKVSPFPFPGVDELTIGIPANVHRAGATVTLVATANGKASNVAKVRLPE
ncbi:hypothetical protein F183_A38520 [Bryobacterales bacterium F-183]|nr:hypothetical protein F183_A38520 [Bryobacterales bacterium F-183]